MKNVTNLKFKDEDGGGDDYSLENVSIDMVDNGYLVTFTYDDGDIINMELTEELIKK